MLTNNLIGKLKPIGIDILDHIVVGKGEVLSMRECGAISFI